VAPGFMPGNHELRDRDQGRVWYNARVFPQVFHAGQRYHYRPYIFPSGWYFRAWLYGDYLPDGWYGPDYYLDWSYFDLPPPPIGCEWVREGNDALLVDVWTGEVLSVSHDMFW
jgi:Ni/Co efflux regulator RcnB